ATVSVTVNPVNHAPMANADHYVTDEDLPLTVTAANGVLANDIDVDGDLLEALLVMGPAHGVLSLNVDGSFRYLGATNYNGTDNFTYQADDGILESGIATVTITVRAVNDA